MNLDHLLESVRPTASQPAEQRLQEVKRACWLPYPRAVAILDAMEELLAWPKRSRMPNLLVVGSTNNGKSSVLEAFLRRHPVSSEPTKDADHVPVVMVKTPPGPDEKAFYNEILRQFATPILTSTHVRDARLQVIRVLTATKVRMLIIDDIHDLMAGDQKRHHMMLVVIKYLANELRIPIVAAGVESALNAVQAESQLSNRFQPTFLPRWENDKDFVALLANFEAVLPLQQPSGLHRAEFASLIHQMGEGILGEVAHVLAIAASSALRDGEERITLKRLRSVEWTPPSQRRRRQGSS